MSTAKQLFVEWLLSAEELVKPADTLVEVEYEDVIEGSRGFYIVQVLPEVLPLRLKFGYTDNLARRLGEHRCIAPTLRLLKSFTCDQKSERLARYHITNTGCVKVGNEVYDVDSITRVLAVAENFFNRSANY